MSHTQDETLRNAEKATVGRLESLAESRQTYMLEIQSWGVKSTKAGRPGEHHGFPTESEKGHTLGIRTNSQV